jgi:hypothetical protein
MEKVSVKVPPFWPENLQLWFFQLEAQFDLAQIVKDSTKYSYLVASIEPRYLAIVGDIVSNPPTEDKYQTLKAAMMSRCGESEENRLKKLLSGIQLGDRTPSTLLREMQAMVSNTNFDQNILKHLWLQQLPHNTQAILAVGAHTITQAADIADKIHQVYKPVEVASFNQNKPPEPRDTDLVKEIGSLRSQQYRTPDPRDTDLVRELNSLRLQVERLQNDLTQQTHQPRGRNRSRSPQPRNISHRNRSRSRPRYTEPSDICFYHNKYGNRAFKCQPPCKYRKSGNDPTSPQ